MKTFQFLPCLALFVVGLMAACGTGQQARTADNPHRFTDPVELTEVVVDMQSMKFTPNRIRTKAGQPLMITLINDDSLNHDFVIRDDSKPVHVFVSPGRRISTSLYFELPGVYEFVCSQKGHESAGMIGQIEVLPDPTK